jgi:hypothetical protein
VGAHVVLGEGDRDKAFVDYLCRNRNIAGLTFDFAGGNAGFSQRLLAMSAVSGFAQCKAILLMSDNDESPDDSFEAIRDQLRQTIFPLPAHPLEMTHKQGMPSLAVLMLPYPQQGPDSRGCLETLLIPAMQAANPTQANCIDQMLACAGVPAWRNKNAQDKAKVRSLIAVAYPNDPMHGLHLCFAPEKGLIPLDHPVFSETALVLEHFAAWSASNFRSWADWRQDQGI